MLDKMFIVITLRKEVPDRFIAKDIYELVKQRMSDRPDVTVKGHCSNHFDMEEE